MVNFDFRSRNCYCNERINNPALAESMKTIPDGFCGICEVCGKPGHTCAHPDLPTTGAWCDKHWDDLTSARVFNWPRLIVRFVVLITVAAGLYTFRNPLAEIPLHAFTVFFKNDCAKTRYNGKAPTIAAIQHHIKSACDSKPAGSEENVLVNLADHTPFKWDTLYVVKPYSLKIDIVKKIGLNGKVLACSKSGFYDEWTQLVFVFKGEVVNFFDIPTHGLIKFGGKTEYGVKDVLFSVPCPETQT